MREVAKPSANRSLDAPRARNRVWVEVLAARARVVDGAEAGSFDPPIAQLHVLVADLGPVLVEPKVAIDDRVSRQGQIHAPEVLPADRPTVAQALI